MHNFHKRRPLTSQLLLLRHTPTNDPHPKVQARCAHRGNKQTTRSVITIIVCWMLFDGRAGRGTFDEDPKCNRWDLSWRGRSLVSSDATYGHVTIGVIWYGLLKEIIGRYWKKSKLSVISAESPCTICRVTCTSGIGDELGFEILKICDEEFFEKCSVGVEGWGSKGRRNFPPVWVCHVFKHNSESNHGIVSWN